jgi:hypothetical protein
MENGTTRKTITITHRGTGAVGTVLDVTGWDDRRFGRLWDALVMKVDFGEWMPVYAPARLDRETSAEWLAR